MSEQKPTMKEIHSVLCEAWEYIAYQADVIDGDDGRPHPLAEKVIANNIDVMLTRLENMEEFNV